MVGGVPLLTIGGCSCVPPCSIISRRIGTLPPAGLDSSLPVEYLAVQ